MLYRPTCVVVCVLLAAGAVHGFNAEDLIKNLNTARGQRQLEAALRLGDFNYPEVITALSAKLDDAATDATVRAGCARSLAKLNSPSTYPMIESLAKKSEEKAVVRTACLQSMAAIKGEDAIPTLVEMLKTEKNLLVRRMVEMVLGGMADTQRVSIAITPLLKDEAAAPSAIVVLGVVGGPGVIAPLAKQLDSPKARIRWAVIRAIGGIPHPDSVPPLLAFYRKANDAEKSQILAVFGQHPHPDVVELLISELQNRKTFAALRRRSALTLGTLKAPTAVKPLVTVMLDTTQQTGLRMTCAQSLGQFSDREDYAIAGLIGALADKGIAETASLSLARVTKRYFGTDKDKWLAWFEKRRNQRNRSPNVGH